MDQKSQHDGVRVHRAHLLDDGTGSSLENSTDAWGKKSVPSPPEPPLRRSYCWSEARMWAHVGACGRMGAGKSRNTHSDSDSNDLISILSGRDQWRCGLTEAHGC